MGYKAYGPAEIAATIQEHLIEAIDISEGPIPVASHAGAPVDIVDVSTDEVDFIEVTGVAFFAIRTSDGREFQVKIAEVNTGGIA